MSGNSSLHMGEGEIHKYYKSASKRDGGILNFVKIVDRNHCEVTGMHCFPTPLDI